MNNTKPLMEFFNRLIFQNTELDRERDKAIIYFTQIEHFRHCNDRTYINMFKALYKRCDRKQMGFLALFYERVFYRPRRNVNIVAPFWKGLDNQIMRQLERTILDSDEDTPDTKKIAEEVKISVIQELENKQKAEQEKAEYERRERNRLKKINKRKRARERQNAEQKAEELAEQKAEELAEQEKEEKEDLKIEQDINNLQEIINTPEPQQEIKRPEKIDYTLCPCGSKTARKDLHEKTARHKNYIESGKVHKAKSQTERNIKRYQKNSQIITRCQCGEDVKQSAKTQHEQSKKHIYFIEHGYKQPVGNHLIRCECGTYFLKYNMSRHKNTLGHKHYLAGL